MVLTVLVYRYYMEFAIEPQPVSLGHKISLVLVFVLLPNIYYFFVGISSVFASWRNRYACVTKTSNLLDKQTKSV